MWRKFILQFWAKKIVKFSLYIGMLYYLTIKPKGLFELYFIGKTHATPYEICDENLMSHRVRKNPDPIFRLFLIRFT